MATRKIGKYQLLERLGRGGMAEVYRAHHVSLDRYVAIKVLHAFLADDPEFKERFENEARNIARLKHPHIVQVYDFENDSENESYFMVMELIDGPTLKDVLASLGERGQMMPITEAIRIVREAASALAYAHSQKMIHRDVKPANLMLDSDNRVILTDFGIAKIVTGAQFTASGGMVGTPAYMAPEQGIGDAGDERSDLYSLGVIFFQLVTGRLPYDAETPLAIILKHLNGPIPSARDFNPDVSEAVDNIITRLLAKEPRDRYQTANEVIADLERVERGEAVEKAAVTAPAPEKFDTMPLPASMREELAAATAAANPPAAAPAAAALPPATTTPPPPRRRLPLWSWVLIGGIIGAAIFGLLQGGALVPILGFLASPTPTYTLTPTLTPTDTPTLTPTDTPTLTPTNTDTPTPTFTPTNTDTPTPTPTPSETFTMIPTNTVQVTLTETPSLTPSTTLTPSETYTPSVTPTPSTTLTPTLDITLTLIQATLISDFQTATINACDFNYEIVAQVPEDGGDVAANQNYTRNITLRNIGTCAWERNSALMFISGENFNAGARIIIRDRVNVGDEVTLTFTGRTPAAHEPLSGVWELRTPGNIRIGQPLTITISVFGG